MTIQVNQRWVSWPLSAAPVVEGAVDIWHASLSALESRMEQLASLLSAEEQYRAARYKLEVHRGRCRLVSGLLRSLLGAYLDQNPATLVVVRGSAGKPALAGKLAQRLPFNISHSHDRVVLAFSTTAAVGVDIEYLRKGVDPEVVIEHVFSPAEILTYRTADADEKLRCFFRIWTRKEARLKACGLDMGSIRNESVNRLPTFEFESSEGYLGAVALCSLRNEFHAEQVAPVGHQKEVLQ